MKKIIKDEKDIMELVEKDKFQVFLLVTKVFKPYQFAVHSWIMTSNKGKLKRWDVFDVKNGKGKRWGYVYLNGKKFSAGGNIYEDKEYPKYDSKIIRIIEGEENSLAQKIIKFTDKHAKEYPMRNKYVRYPGPNSNTFTQWIINKFPETKWKLPWNAFGKNYKIK